MAPSLSGSKSSTCPGQQDAKVSTICCKSKGNNLLSQSSWLIVAFIVILQLLRLSHLQYFQTPMNDRNSNASATEKQAINNRTDFYFKSTSNGAWWNETTFSGEALANDLDILPNSSRSELFNCGYWKCYAPSRHHLTIHKSFGYLIGQRRNAFRNPSKFSFQNIQRGYDLALDLEKKYRVRHLMISPPITITTKTSPLVKVLNGAIDELRKRQPERTRSDALAPFRVTTPDRIKRDKFTVQVMQQVPQPSILIRMHSIQKYSKHNSDVIPQRILTELLGLPPLENYTFSITNRYIDIKKNIMNLSSLDIIEKFQTTFEGSWKRTKDAYREEPRLYQDCQFLIDQSGQFWELDFDRVWGNIKTKDIKQQLAHNEAYVEKMLIQPVLKKLKDWSFLLKSYSSD